MTSFLVFVVEDEESVRYGFPSRWREVSVRRSRTPSRRSLPSGKRRRICPHGYRASRMNGVEALKAMKGSARSHRAGHHRLRGRPDGRGRQ